MKTEYTIILNEGKISQWTYHADSYDDALRIAYECLENNDMTIDIYRNGEYWESLR